MDVDEEKSLESSGDRWKVGIHTMILEERGACDDLNSSLTLLGILSHGVFPGVPVSSQ